MNPLVVWLPSIAAAALLGTAVVVMSDKDDEYAAYQQPVAPPQEALPEAAQTAEEIEQAAEPTAEEVKPDAEELQAVKDGDGSGLLSIMEEQLENSRRILSTMKASPPTFKALKAIVGFRKRAAREIRELKDMGAARVPADVFHRSEEIIQEIKGIEVEAVEIMRAEKERRGPRRGEQPAPVAAQPEPAYAQPEPTPVAYAQPEPYVPPAPVAYAQPEPAYAAPQAYAPQY
jgi:hypothetical protein